MIAGGNLVTADGIIQIGDGVSKGGLIKFFDTGAGNWKDMTLSDGILFVGGIAVGSSGGGVELDDTTASDTTTYSSTKIETLTYDSTAVDTHIGDTATHFIQGDISITESQISDLQSYLTEHQDISTKAEKLNIQYLRYEHLVGIDGEVKYEIKTELGASIDINLSTHFTAQGSVYVNGRKVPHTTITFTFEVDKNYLELTTAPGVDEIIEIERIFI